MRSLVTALLTFVASGVLAAPPVTTISDPPTLPPTLPPVTTKPTLTLTPTTTRPTPSPTPDTCICPGKLLCCKAVVDASDESAQWAIKELGGVIYGFNVTVGLGCLPYSTLGIEGTVKCKEPVCCMDADKPEIAAIGCVKVPPPKPTITFTTITPTPTTITLPPTRTPIDPTRYPLEA